ncbi:MAG TPA: 16S rRNA (adenine(1518)-N(6)/adenine(1519)-N(6))-dimethyltransferase RsmA [Terriglobales bacterium]|nr:16S rRNA (adenine(1518)-N(6)/adenine(1519)-N(6))-dimethyltransferase RsmA [Terriglobales bacterium]
MTLSELRRVLAERGIQLTKSLGQHFLHDANQLRRIVQTAELTAVTRVLEIGPGLGALTELLLASGAEVFAIEKDARLVAELQRRFAAESRLRLLHADALVFLQKEARDWHDWKLVSNLPYSVASPILVELALQNRPPERIVATLQLEVARRLMAGASDDDYGVLSLLVQLRYEPRGLFKIPAGCFFPEPDVASACVTLVRRGRELLPSELQGPFSRVVKLAFSQRRKMMLKLLKQQWPAEKLEAAFAALGIPPQARAESLSLEQFVELTKQLKS